MRQLDQTVPQDVKRDKGDDQYTETSTGYDEDNRRN